MAIDNTFFFIRHTKWPFNNNNPKNIFLFFLFASIEFYVKHSKLTINFTMVVSEFSKEASKWKKKCITMTFVLRAVWIYRQRSVIKTMKTTTTTANIIRTGCWRGCIYPLLHIHSIHFKILIITKCDGWQVTYYQNSKTTPTTVNKMNSNHKFWILNHFVSRAKVIFIEIECIHILVVL